MITLPIDDNNKPIQLPPATVAIVATYDATISSSTTITLNPATSYIEVGAIAKGVFLKYGATASSSSFDEFIPQDTIRAFVVPSGVTQVSVIEQAATAAVVIIEK